MEELNQLLRKLDDKYLINCGGCCFIAFCISVHLFNLGIPYKFVCLGTEKLSSRELRNNVKRNRDYPCLENTANHYLLQVGKEYINLGDFDLRYYDVSKTSYIKPIELLYLYRYGCWNSDYDTENNLKIYRIISDFFKPYEKETKNFTSR